MDKPAPEAAPQFLPNGKHRGFAKIASMDSVPIASSSKAPSTTPVKKRITPTLVASDAQKEEKKKLIKSQREGLPIYGARELLIEQVKSNRVLVLVGETGSGKTTQIPQFLHEAGLTAPASVSSKPTCIAVTQPRRVAAVSVARRVAEEMDVKLGQEVGYTIRFEDCSDVEKTRVKYMTDGMLLRETMMDEMLSRYSVIILDEAHERTLHTDVLFGVVKGLLAKREDLKVIIMSATLAAESFSTYFNGCPILYIEGRQYPVDVYFAAEPVSDYLDAAITSVFQIHLECGPTEDGDMGDILVFLTGQEEIESCANIISSRLKYLPPNSPTLMVCPIFAALPQEQQMLVFEPAPNKQTRKVILATNIAETSITIPGVTYVIDAGVVKSKSYNPQIGLEMLLVQEISKAAARQRCGRAGRERAGSCYRLYTEASYLSLQENTQPEIVRVNLSSVVLQLTSLGIKNVVDFDFMDKPDRASIVRAYEQLYALGAFSADRSLSDLGRKMAQFPLDPMYAKVLIQSSSITRAKKGSAKEEEEVFGDEKQKKKAEGFNCTEEILDIVSLLAVENIFYMPREKRQMAEAARKRLASPYGDHLTLMHVFREYRKYFIGAKDTHWCFHNFINERSMKKAVEVRKQLLEICHRMGMAVASCGDDTVPLRKCLASGFFLHTALRQSNGKYRTILDQQEAAIHPSSVIHPLRPRPECVVYNQLILTADRYLRDCVAIDYAWLPEVAPAFFAAKATASSSSSSSDASANRHVMEEHEEHKPSAEALEAKRYKPGVFKETNDGGKIRVTDVEQSNQQKVKFNNNSNNNNNNNNKPHESHYQGNTPNRFHPYNGGKQNYNQHQHQQMNRGR